MQFFRDWQDFFDHVRNRPGLYIGRKSLELLGAYLNGFGTAEQLHDIPPGQRMFGFDFEGFERFIGEKIEVNSFGSMFLARRDTSSEEEAWDLWFKWYDEFLGRDPKADSPDR